MKKTNAEIIKDIKRLEVEKNDILSEESETMTTTYGLDEKPLPSEYDYKKTQKALDDIDAEVRHLKSALAKSNANTMVKGFDMTINEALVYLAQLNFSLSRLQSMARRKELTRTSGSYNSKAELTRTNYDIKEVKKNYQKTQETITKLQMAIDLTNLTNEVDL